MKKYYFLSGLPRSGNTLLSAILNQNPDFYVSPLSPMPEILYRNVSILEDETFIANSTFVPMQEKVIKNLFDLFYSDIKEPIVFDRSKWWSLEPNFNILKDHIDPDVKILFTVRSIVDILASLVKLNLHTHRQEMFENQPHNMKYLSYDDALCDFLMRSDLNIAKILASLKFALDSKYSKNYHIIDYDDLMSNPQQTMSNVYKFLEQPEFEHDFNNIFKREVDDDAALNLPANLHEVKKVLKKSSNDAKSILSEYTYNKYINEDFWRNK